MNRNPTITGLIACLVPALFCRIVWPESAPEVLVLGSSILVCVYFFYRRLSFDLNSRTARASEDIERSILAEIRLTAWLDPEGRMPVKNSWSLSSDALLIYLDAIADGPESHVIECGSGSSTVWAALLLKKLNRTGCKVHALESDAGHADQTTGQLERLGLAEFAEVHHCPLVDRKTDAGTARWYDLSGVPDTLEASIVLVDGPPSHGTDVRWPAPFLLDSRTSGKCRFFLDDANRPGEFQVLDRWSGAFPRALVRNHEASRGFCEFRLPGKND